MLTGIAVIFIGGLILGAVFAKIKLPSLVGMLLAGMILGPRALNLIDSAVLDISADLRQLALVIILARAGLSLDIDDLKKIGRPAVMMSFIPACFEMTGTILVAPWLLGVPLLDAAIMAAVVASASPAVIVPRMIRLIEEGYGADKLIPQMILAGDSVDDVFNIVVFTALVGVASGRGASAASFVVVPVSILLGILIGVAAGFLLDIIFRHIKMRDSVKVLLLLSIAFLLLALEEFTGEKLPFSALLSVMTAGVVLLRRSPVRAAGISAKLSRLWVGAEVLLFVLVGASLNVQAAADAGLKTALMLVIILIFRACGILICLVKTNITPRERLFCTFTGIPKATVQAAIGGIPLAMGLRNGELILAVAVLTVLITAPLGAFVIDSTYKRLLNEKNEA